MGWRDLLQKNDETVVLPWLGGRSLRSGPRTWYVDGRLPPEHGWHKFTITGRKAAWSAADEAAPDILKQVVRGYLVGDHLLQDDVRVELNPKDITKNAERVVFVDPGLDRFVRISAGRPFEDGPLVFIGQEMPQGAEDEVLQAYLDETSSVDQVKGVPPALDAAFRLETWRRAEAERVRQEIECKRREEEQRLALEERRRDLVKKLGDGEGRREMARVDFDAAARAALAVGGAQFLDARNSVRRSEKVVRFRFLDRRFECVCDATSLRIIDSGICLIDHGTNEKGDNYFTLESLPAVISQANDEGRLVVFRHA